MNSVVQQFFYSGYNGEHCLSWIQGDAEALSFEDGSMDGYTIAFGIRNVTHIEKVLAEAYRFVSFEILLVLKNRSLDALICHKIDNLFVLNTYT